MASELETRINSAMTEREIVRWLKQKENAWILPPALKVAPFGKYAVPEFPFGTDYRADFVVINLPGTGSLKTQRDP
jgi:hypothetical protein